FMVVVKSCGAGFVFILVCTASLIAISTLLHSHHGLDFSICCWKYFASSSLAPPSSRRWSTSIHFSASLHPCSSALSVRFSVFLSHLVNMVAILQLFFIYTPLILHKTVIFLSISCALCAAASGLSL